jgi:hypothetical protein
MADVEVGCWTYACGGINARDGSGDGEEGEERTAGEVVVAEFAGFVVVIKVDKSLPASLTAGFGIRSYSCPVLTVPPCEGVCPSLCSPAARRGWQSGYSLILVSSVSVGLLARSMSKLLIMTSILTSSLSNRPSRLCSPHVLSLVIQAVCSIAGRLSRSPTQPASAYYVQADLFRRLGSVVDPQPGRDIFPGQLTKQPIQLSTARTARSNGGPRAPWASHPGPPPCACGMSSGIIAQASFRLSKQPACHPSTNLARLLEKRGTKCENLPYADWLCAPIGSMIDHCSPPSLSARLLATCNPA